MRLSTKLTVAFALAIATTAGPASAAHKEWRALPKGGGYYYAVPHAQAAPRTRTAEGYVISSQFDCPRTAIHRHAGKGPETLVCPVR